MTAAAVVLVVVAATGPAARRAVNRCVRTRLPARPRPPRRLRAPAWFAAALDDAALDVPAEQAWTAWWGAAACAAVAAQLLSGPGLAAVALGTVVAAPPCAWIALRGQAVTRVESALPAVLEHVARALRSGASLASALAEAAVVARPPLGSQLRDVALAATRGQGLVRALEAWAGGSVAGVRLAAAALCLAAETGGSPARALDGVALTLRSRQGARAEARALGTQARMSAAVIATAPLAFAVVTTGAGGATADFLLRTPAGLTCLAAGLALDAAGAVWMARITRRVA